jgi:hypothetical protein
MKKGPREAIIWLGNVFQRICAKVIKRSEISNLQTYNVETMYLLEIYFPPGFWDIMPHLVLHIVDELEICGPIHAC